MAFNGKGGGYDIKKYYNTPIYRTWYNMKTRCLNKKSTEYKRYGERGITICNEWMYFKNFLADMLPIYEEGLTIDRKDNNKGYYKENCRWTDKKTQARNTRNVEKAQRFCLFGTKMTVTELSEKFNIKRSTLSMRLQQYGWPLHKALNT